MKLLSQTIWQWLLYNWRFSLDLYGFEHATPASHYEVSATKNTSIAAYKLKSKAFLAMDELEGWCAKDKAATLIDLVLMLKPKIVVEIGVFGGKSLVPIAYALQETGSGKNQRSG